MKRSLVGRFVGSFFRSVSGVFSGLGNGVGSFTSGVGGVLSGFLGASGGGFHRRISSIAKVLNSFRKRFRRFLERGLLFGGASGQSQSGRSSRSGKSKFDRHVVYPSDGSKSVPEHACPDGVGVSHDAGSNGKQLNHCE